MTKRALRSIVRVCPGRHGSPPGPYWCSQCKREILPGEEYAVEVYRHTMTEERDDGALFCADCREIPVPDGFADLTNNEAGKVAAKVAIENLPRGSKR